MREDYARGHNGAKEIFGRANIRAQRTGRRTPGASWL